MRIKEIISEGETAENISVDWNKLSAALTVIATDPDLKGVKPVDAIMFLGLIGDPNAGEWDIDMKVPARFGVLNDKGMSIPYTKQGIQGFYNSPGSFHRDDAGKHFSFGEFDILINPKYWQELSVDTDTPELIAHEARHRGMDIIFRNPITLSKIPKKLQDYRDIDDWPQKGKDKEYWDSWEHLCLWSLERRGRSDYSPKHIFTSKQEMLQFRGWYYQLEAIAKQYVSTLKVTPGGYEALRKEIDKKTPGNMDIKITQGPKGTPIIKGIVDKIKSAVTPTPPPVANQSPKVSSDPTLDSEEPANSTPSVKNTDYKGSVGSQKLQQLNPSIKNVNLIYPGQKIKLPNNNTVTVKPGDTLDKIAAQNNIKEDQLSRIKQLSGLRS